MTGRLPYGPSLPSMWLGAFARKSWETKTQRHPPPRDLGHITIPLCVRPSFIMQDHDLLPT